METTKQIRNLSIEQLSVEVRKIKNRIEDPSTKYYCRKNLNLLLKNYEELLASKKKAETSKISRSINRLKLALGVLLILISLTGCELGTSETPNIVKYFDGAYNDRRDELKEFSRSLGEGLTRVYSPKHYANGNDYVLDTISGETYFIPSDPSSTLRNYLEMLLEYHDLDRETSILHVLYSPSKEVVTFIQNGRDMTLVDKENYTDLESDYQIFVTEFLYTLNLKDNEYVYMQVDLTNLYERSNGYVLRTNFKAK